MEVRRKYGELRREEELERDGVVGELQRHQFRANFHLDGVT